MLKKAIYLGVLLASCFSCQSPKEQLIEHIETLKSQTEFNGIAYIEHNGDVLFDGNIISTNESLPAPKRDTEVYLASLTKLFTEIVVAKLIEENKLDMETTISTYRKNFKPSFGNNLSLKNLLKMSSGLPRELDDDNLMSSLKFDENGFAGTFLDTIPDFELKFEPGTDNDYSNLNYWLIGSIIEEVTGLNLNDAYSKYIFEPLKMTNSGYNNAVVKPLDGHVLKDNKWVIEESNFVGRYASGGCYSSLNDLILLSKALKDNNYLNQDAKALLYNSNVKKIEVYGALPNYTNMLYFNHDENITALVLNNIGVQDLSKMAAIKNSIDEVVGINQNTNSKKKNNVVLKHINGLNDSIPLEAAMKQWIKAIEDGDKDKIISVLTENSYDKNDPYEIDDPTWDEIIRHRNEYTNFRVHGYRWVENQDLNGLEIWFIYDGDPEPRLTFLWIVDKAKSKDLSTGLHIKPDNTTWLGQKFN